MIVLSFDTSLAASSAAVVEVGGQARVLAASYEEPGRGHAEILLAMIKDVMTGAGVGFEDIDRQIVTMGPGSFTGVRVALSAARGFRVAHNIPICSLTTMQAVAANISRIETLEPQSLSAVIIDARRHQAYGQVFDATLKPLCAPSLIEADSLESWLEPWKDMPLVLMGTGAGLVRTKDCALPGNWTAIHEYSLPDAACFAAVLKHIRPDEAPSDPLYLRQPDAKPQIIGQKNA